jgi:hypothetical protein
MRPGRTLSNSCRDESGKPEAAVLKQSWKNRRTNSRVCASVPLRDRADLFPVQPPLAHFGCRAGPDSNPPAIIFAPSRLHNTTMR